MTKFLVLFFLLLSYFINMGQEHTGKYYGTVENDTIGKIEVTFNLYADSTYIITANFDYYGINDGRCFDGQTWNYYGKWLSFQEYLFFKPCKSDEHLADSTYKCQCCEFPNEDFDFWETFRTISEKQKYEKRKWYKIFDKYNKLDYSHRLKLNLETKEIFFHFGWDCHEEIWIDHSVKKVE